MPWIEALLKGQKVFARANEKGELVAESGRVEVRYKPKDGKAYRAAKGNLEIVGTNLLPDEHCSDGGKIPSKYEQKKDKKAAAAKRVQPHPEGHIVAYTDGACSGNPGPAGSGLLVMTLDGKKLESFRYLGDRSTNNVAELTAIEMALDAVEDRDADYEIRTDSLYAIGMLAKNHKAKANQELIAKIKAKLALRSKTKLQYVPGHAEVEGNERADVLAREAITSRGDKPLTPA
jgi:ribonuclease HI